MSTGPILDQPPIEWAANQRSRVTACSLTVASMTDGAAPLVQTKTLLQVGYIVTKDAHISFHGVRVPPHLAGDAIVRVEFTTVDDEPEVPTCSVCVTYLDVRGKPQRSFTPPLNAAGDLAEFQISSTHLGRDRILSLAVGFVLTSEDEEHQKRPVLLRGAWIEFPE